MEDCTKFLKQIKKLKSYVVKDIIKPKVYFSDCIIKKENQWPIIVITDNKYIFFANNKV